MCLCFFRLVWPCVMNVGWRERNQQDAVNLIFIIKLLSQHISGVIMPIIRRTRVCTAVSRVPAPYNHSHHNQCRTPYAAVHTYVVLMIDIMMSETCWDKSLIINIRLVASCWFLPLHPMCLCALCESQNQPYICPLHPSSVGPRSGSSVCFAVGRKMKFKIRDEFLVSEE